MHIIMGTILNGFSMLIIDYFERYNTRRRRRGRKH